MKIFPINDHLVAALSEEDARDYYTRKICLPVHDIRGMEMTKGFKSYIEEFEYWRKCQLRKGYPGDPFFINPE